MTAIKVISRLGSLVRSLAILLTCFAGSSVIAAVSEYSEEGDNDRWSNPENWTNGVPSFGDEAFFSPDEASGTTAVDFDVSATVGTFKARTQEISLGTGSAVFNLDLTLDGRPGTTLTTGSFVLLTDFTTSAAGGGGEVEVTLKDMTVNADLIKFTRVNTLFDHETTFVLKLVNSDFNLSSFSDFEPEGGTIYLFAGSTLANSRNGNLDVDRLVFRGGGTLDWQANTRATLDVGAGGGRIVESGLFRGPIELSSGGSALLRFGSTTTAPNRFANLEGVISGPGGIVADNANYTVRLRADNTFEGGIFLYDGVVTASRGKNLGSIDNHLYFTNGTLRTTENFTIGIDATFVGDHGAIDTDGNNVWATGAWRGSSAAAFAKKGAGVLTLDNDGSDYEGDYVVDEGTLVSGDGDTFSNNSTVIVNPNGLLRFDQNENFGALSGSGMLNANFQTIKLLKGDAPTADFSGSVVGSGVIEKSSTGGGEQRFSGDNGGFTGTWRVNGQMAFASADSLHRPAQIGSSGILVFDPDSGASSHGANISGGATSRIHKRGGGTITLTNGNLDFTGSYELVGGTLQLDAAPSQFASIVITEFGTLSTSQDSIQYVTPVTIAQDGASIDTGDGQIILNGALGGLKGTGTLHKRGAGTLNIFSASNDFSGGVRVRDGLFQYSRRDMLDGASLAIDSGASAGGIQSGTSSFYDYQLGKLTGGGTLNIPAMQSVSIGEGNDSDYTFSGKLNGNGQLIKVGTGAMILSGDNRQFGGQVIAANGTLKLSSLNALPDGSGLEIRQAATAEVVAESRTSELRGNGQLRLTGGRFFVGLGDASSTFDGRLTGSRDLWKTGAGTFTLTGSQIDYDGAYMVIGGLLQLSNAHPSANPQITMQGGGIRAGGAITLSKTVFNNGGSIDTNGFDVHLSGSLFGNEELVKKGLGELRLSGSNNLQNTIDVEQGSLRISSTASINGNTSVELQSGTAAIFDADARLGNLTGRGGIHLGGNTLTVSSVGVTEFNGWILGSGTFDKWSDGELTLSGDASLFSGDFLVRGSGSILNLEGEYSPSKVLIDNNAALGGNADINSLVYINPFGTLAPGRSAGKMTIDELNLDYNSAYEVELGGAATGQFDSVLVEGDATIHGSLEVSLIDGYFPKDGDSLMVLEVLGERTGEFANFAEGDLVMDVLSPQGLSGGLSTKLFITYAGGNGNDIVLYAAASVPEPSTATLLTLLSFLLFMPSEIARKRYT